MATIIPASDDNLGRVATALELLAGSKADIDSETLNAALDMASGHYQGRDISKISALTDELNAAGSVPAFLQSRAATGNYTGLSIHDYTSIGISTGSIVHEIGSFDHDYNACDTAQGHTITMVAKTTYPIPSTDTDYVKNGSYIQMNTTSTNQGNSSAANPYLASNLYKYITNVLLPRYPSAWQNVMKTKRTLAPSRYSSSGTLTDDTSWYWADLGKIWIPSEMEIYGCSLWATKNGYAAGVDTQLHCFQETKDRERGRITYWLRSAAGGSSTAFCYCNNNGNANYNDATNTWKRPLP